MAIGLYRERKGSGDSARVLYPDGRELDIPRVRYEQSGYEPPFNDLPTRAVYEAAQKTRG